MITKTSSGYEVRSEDGKKRLGGPYKTKGEAQKRLAQVEHFRKNSTTDNMEVITANIQTSGITHETLEGRECWRIPIAMLEEGVLNGSKGPVFYPEDENKKWASVWNHKPIVVYHPRINGKDVSACTVDVLNTSKVGVMLDTFHDNKLRTFGYVDKERADKIDPRIRETIEKNESMEVSTGLHLDFKQGEGKFGEKKYELTACNYRPDHLALLPDCKGAYSIADGGGMNVTNEEDLVAYNKKYSAAAREKLSKGDFGEPSKKGFPVKDQKDLENAAKLLHHAADPSKVKKRLIAIAKKKGLTLPESWSDGSTKNEASHSEKYNQVSTALRAKMEAAGAPWDGYMHDMYDKHVIYASGGQLYKHDYTHDEKKGVSFSGKPVPVKRKTEYQTMDGKPISNQEPVTNSEPTMDKKVTVDQLIANKHWDEKDREWLMGLEETRLTKLVPIPVTQTTVTNVTPPVTATAPVTPSVVAPPIQQPVTAEAYIAAAPPGIREVLQNGLAAHETEKSTLVAAIMANPKNVFNEAFLKDKSVPELRGIVAISGGQQTTTNQQQSRAMFIGAGGAPPITNGHQQKPLVAPVFNWREEKIATAAAKN